MTFTQDPQRVPHYGVFEVRLDAEVSDRLAKMKLNYPTNPDAEAVSL